MAGTAYKLRKQIAKALQARSKAVKTAITTYNAAAEAMSPAKPTLDWEQVVEFAFLADFDLLREAREDIRDETWALPAGRVAMDAHYKLLRADEEIGRLDVEIPRFVTHMVDEEAFLLREEARLRDEGKEGIAHQVRLLRMERARFTTLHMYRLVKLSKEPGFSASIRPGISVSRERHLPVVRDDQDEQMRPASPASPVAGDIEMDDASAPPHENPAALLVPSREAMRDARVSRPNAHRDLRLPRALRDDEDSDSDEDGIYLDDQDDHNVAGVMLNLLRITQDGPGAVDADYNN